MSVEGPSEGLRPALKAFSRSVIIALVVLIAVALGSLQVLRVNGPVYHRIVLGKDLIADILPPPEYVLEAYLEATLALNSAGAVQNHADRLAVLKTQYDERQVYWTQSDLDASLKQQILEASNAPAQRFWTTINADFLPALRRGDSAAAAQAYGQISAAHDEHRAAVDKLVIDANTANVSAERFAKLSLALFVGLMLLVTAGLIAMVVRRAARIALDVVDPLSHMTQVMIQLSSGDLQVAIPHADRTDEVGAMAKALEAFKAQGRESARLRDEENLARTGRDNDRRVAEGQRASALQVMADRVERETRDAVATVAEAMQAVSTRAGDMARSAASVDASSDDVAVTANEAMARSKSVATTAKALDTAIRRITLQVNDARTAAAQVVGAASEAETSIDSLSRAVDQISRVTDLIAEIARQTNMLALNASVEAARAGETGKGFAVVAGEVRSLAEQTAAATAEIRNLIGGVHDSANSTITAVQGISVQVKGVDIASLAIASAVEEQAQATMAIASSIDETSAMAERMAHSVRLVSQEARAAEAISREVNALSISVTDEIDQLSSTLVRVVRTSTSEVERRRRPRYAVNMAAQLSIQGARHQIEAVNLSVGGALVLGAMANPGTRVTLQLSGIDSPIKAEVIGLDREMLHLKFDASPAQQTQLEALIARNGAPALDDGVGDTQAA